MKKARFLAIALSTSSSLLFPHAASAQQTTSPDATVPAQAASEAAGINDIVVTAQRRAENLQKSSLSISVLTAEQIGRQGVSRTEDIARIAPGVQIGTSGAIPQIYVRGVGDPSQTALSNPAIALNIGGVNYARPQAAGTAFYDLERIEVLKGPQGTLYGRNSSGGAVNVLPTRPKLGTLEGLVNIEAGNYQAISSDGAINLPLGDTVALRASYLLRTRDGYLSDGSSDDKRQAVRLQLLFEPSDAVSVLLFGAYAHMGGIGNGYALYDPKGNPLRTPPRPSIGSFDPWTSATDARGAAILATGAPPPVLTAPDPNGLYQNNEFWNFQGELNADLGFAKLTFIPSYQRSTIDYKIFSSINFQVREDAGRGRPESSKAYSGELRLSNESDWLKWVVGGFYYNEKQHYVVTANQGLLQNVSLSADLQTESAAAFGQATASVSNTIRLIGGLRYTEEKRNLAGTRTSNLPVPGTNPLPVNGIAKSSSVDFKVGFEFDLAPQNMLYGNYTTGFKAGGVSPAVAPPYQPERVKTFTLGMRNRFFDNKLQVNVEGFYLEYKNQQVQSVAPDNLGILSGLIYNAGQAKSYGAEGSVVFQATSNDNLSASLVYNKTRYDSFIYQTPQFALPSGKTGCVVTPASPPFAQVDCSGQSLPLAPKWTGNVAYSHVFDLDTNGTLTFNGDMQFASEREASADFIPNTRLPAYQVFNAALTYALPGDTLSVTGFVRNISNEPVYLAAFQNSFVPSFVGVSIAPPRTYGLRLSYRY
ncbi:iron complex outermembrane receptor protein [Sphingobium xenophagum]|uniref:Iron complex outermembrane receptor protein n=1 Tax=Sphingobium xenophagum TaxID=121428 RepID=A0ABU1X2A9_SPHXE|nr:TonB-dependent receptor [Sphingobium xenophagum]MDR7155710.1 iron complex outermembrane receptor protein [Sphingobium xenophagum]